MSTVSLPLSVRPGSAIGRARSKLLVVWSVLRVAAPPAGRWLSRVVRRTRTAAFYAGALASVCYGVWQTLGPGAGWIAIGVGLFVFEGLSWKPAHSEPPG